MTTHLWLTLPWSCSIDLSICSRNMIKWFYKRKCARVCYPPVWGWRRKRRGESWGRHRAERAVFALRRFPAVRRTHPAVRRGPALRERSFCKHTQSCDNDASLGNHWGKISRTRQRVTASIITILVIVNLILPICIQKYQSLSMNKNLSVFVVSVILWMLKKNYHIRSRKPTPNIGTESSKIKNTQRLPNVNPQMNQHSYLQFTQ